MDTSARSGLMRVFHHENKSMDNECGCQTAIDVITLCHLPLES
jgi:hypothetical protein